MAKHVPQTVGEALYWCYANLAMMANVLEDGVAEPAPRHFAIRSRLYAGLCKETMGVSGYYQDERLKLTLPKCCWYCGDAKNLSVDHLVSREDAGTDTGENLVHACRACNSSKGSRDFLEWMQLRGQFPPLYLLRRYLKMAIQQCQAHNLMLLPISEAKQCLPFRVDLLPNSFPSVSQLCKFVHP